VTHLGQQLSALVDGELEASKRERVLDHVTRCGSCRDEVAALRALKRRTSAAFRENPASAGLTGLTGRLMGLSEMGLDESRCSGWMPSGGSVWPPPPPPPSGWPAPERSSQDSGSADRDGRQDQRAGRLFLAGSVAIFLAGLGTAAVIAGGEPQAQAPAPPVTPSIDVLVAPHNPVNQGLTGVPGTGVLRRGSTGHRLHPDVDATYQAGQP
jgi:anti-sigma factor RsiW